MSLNTTDVENPYDDDAEAAALRLDDIENPYDEYSEEEEIADEGDDNNFGEQLDAVFAELVAVVEINRSSSC
jgi:hypothetical protein